MPDLTPKEWVGLFSFELAFIINELVESGMMNVSTTSVQSGVRYDFSLTKTGIEYCKKVYPHVDLDIKFRLEKLRTDGDRAGYSEILHYVYSKYPEYTASSKIKQEIVK